MFNLADVVKQDKITVFMFSGLFVLSQVAVKGAVLRA